MPALVEPRSKATSRRWTRWILQLLPVDSTSVSAVAKAPYGEEVVAGNAGIC